MQTILPSEFKRMMVLMLDGSPHVVEDMHTSGTAQTRHKLHTRLRHLKQAKLETGLSIMVPLFITNGETIRVDTVAKKYAGREASEK